jgi:hypothetical protein
MASSRRVSLFCKRIVASAYVQIEFLPERAWKLASVMCTWRSKVIWRCTRCLCVLLIRSTWWPTARPPTSSISRFQARFRMSNYSCSYCVYHKAEAFPNWTHKTDNWYRHEGVCSCVCLQSNFQSQTAICAFCLDSHMRKFMKENLIISFFQARTPASLSPMVIWV